LIFLFNSCILIGEYRFFAASGNGIQSSFLLVFSAKVRENRPSLKRFLRLIERPARDHCVFVSCWAFFRRFSRRFLAGPSRTRMGNVRLFLCLDASCESCYPSEATVFPLQSSSSVCLFSAGNPLVRQTPHAFDSFSRNGSFNLRSGIVVFKNPGIIDK